MITTPKNRFHLNTFCGGADGRTDELSAFASDLGWRAGEWPNSIAIEAANGVYCFEKWRMDHERVIYRSTTGQLVVIFND